MSRFWIVSQLLHDALVRVLSLCQVRAPTRPHPEAANLPPFNETTFAAAKQVDVALDQARMPSLVPTAGEAIARPRLEYICLSRLACAVKPR
jgi:hypothetical protein